MEAIINYFTHIVDFPFVMQLICYSVATVLLLGVRVNADGKAQFRPLVFAIETIALSVVFFAIDLIIALFPPRVSGYFDSSFKYFLGVLLFAVIMSRHSWKNRLVMGTTVFALCILMGEMGTMGGLTIKLVSPNFDIAISKILVYILIIVCAALFYKYPVFKFEIGGFDCALITTCNALSAIVLVVYEYMCRYNVEFMRARNTLLPFVTMVIVAFLVINIVTYFMNYGICREKALTLAYEIEQQKKQSLRELLNVSEAKLTELKEVRHDVKNQYAYMQAMLEEREYDKLKAYFNELIGTFATPLGEQIESGNADIDSILNLELAKMKTKNIKSNIRICVPSELAIKKTALLSLFSNVIDNAIEACERDKPENPTIDIVVGMHGEELLLSVSNPTKLTQEELDAGVVTSKNDKTRHGYGTNIIKKIVKKYNGIYRCYIKDGFFVSESLLGIPSAE